MGTQDPAQGILIDATPHLCPYLADRTAVLPTRWYPEDLDGVTFDRLLAQADRRVGRTFYRPACPDCDACEGIRVPVAGFWPTKSQRKVWRRNADLRVTVGAPQVDSRRVHLFNRHKRERGLGDSGITPVHYASWLVASCVPTVETRYWLDDELVGVGILDVGATAANSVYFYFDPSHEDRSLGTFSVLAEIEWVRRRGMKYYYLGLYVRECAHLSYKTRFGPHERLVGGVWKPFGARAPEAGATAPEVDGPEAPE